jgi:hypothetical protein
MKPPPTLPVPFTAPLILFLVFLLIPSAGLCQSRTVFSGVPVVKVSEGGTERVPETLEREKAINLGCVVSEIRGKYYWATRENKEMVRYVSGAFVTYMAVDGSGYVRLIHQSAKDAASLMSPTEALFDYVEHILIGLRSVTYYGNLR